MVDPLSAGILACFTPTRGQRRGENLSRSESRKCHPLGQFNDAVSVTSPKMAVKTIGEGRFSAKDNANDRENSSN